MEKGDYHISPITCREDEWSRINVDDNESLDTSLAIELYSLKMRLPYQSRNKQCREEEWSRINVDDNHSLDTCLAIELYS